MPCAVRFSKGADSNKGKKQIQWPAENDYDYGDYIIGYKTNTKQDDLCWLSMSDRQTIFSDDLYLLQVSLLAFEGEYPIKKVV